MRRAPAAAAVGAFALLWLTVLGRCQAQSSPQLRRLLARSRFSTRVLKFHPFWQLPAPASVAQADPGLAAVNAASAQGRPLNVASHSRVSPRQSDDPSSAKHPHRHLRHHQRIAVLVPRSFAPFVIFDYLASLGEQADVAFAVYHSDKQLRNTLTNQLGLCSGQPRQPGKPQTIAIVIPPRLHGNALAAIDACKHDRAVWVWNTEQLTNPPYLALTTVLMQQGWRVLDMLPQNRCLARFSLCARGALGRDECGAAWEGIGGGSCPGGSSIRGGPGTMVLESASGCGSRDDDKRLGLACRSIGNGDGLGPGYDGGRPAALRVVPYQLTSEVDRLRELLSRVRPEDREYDVAFVGAPSFGRLAAVAAMRGKGVRVVIANGSPDVRDMAIASARVLINMHYKSQYFVFESLRCDRWIAAGHVVVSEPSWGDAANDLRGAYVTSPEPTPHSLADTVARVLGDLDATRQRVSAVLSERLDAVRAARAASLAKLLLDD